MAATVFDSTVVTATTGHLMDVASRYPRTSVASIFILSVLLLTKIFTTIRFKRQKSKTSPAGRPVAPPEAPYSIPVIKNGTLFLDLHKNLKTLVSSNPTEACITLNVASSRHHIVTSPSLTHQISNSKTIIHKLSLQPFLLRVMRNFWNDGGAVESLSHTSYYDVVHKALNGMMHSSFINTGIPPFVSALSTTTADLVTFSNSTVDMMPWERAAQMNTIAQNPSPKQQPPGGKTATADMFNLIRHFIASLACDNFFSSDLRTNFPSVTADNFLTETKLEPFMAGIPQWLPGNRPAAQARDRLVEAMRQHAIAYWKFHKGQNPGAMWSNVGETSKPMADRVIGCGEGSGDFDEKLPEHKRGWTAAVSNASILWALQVNAPSVAFWVVWWTFATKGLVEEVRAEIKPFITTEGSTGGVSGGIIQEKPRLKINQQGIRTQCPLLLGVLHEVLRMETHSLTYKLITDDFTVTESAEDARIYRGGENANAAAADDAPRTYQFKKGEFVVVPHELHHRDGRYFEQPDKFDPRRFWVTGAGSGNGKSSSKTTLAASAAENSNQDPGLTDDDASSSDNDASKPSTPLPTDDATLNSDRQKISVTYGTTHPWGGGTQYCKGRKFAEYEILLVAAAIIHMWDFRPVKRPLIPSLQWTRLDEWVYPVGGGNAATKPDREVWVEVRRREGV